MEMKTEKKPLTDEYIIGSDKNTAAEFRKYFRKTLGDDYEKYAVVMDVLKNVFSYKGKTLKEITDECRNPSWYDEMGESVASFHVQRETRAKIEDVIPHYLDGGMRQEALDFAAYLQKNGMRLKWDAWNTWKVFHKNKVLCWVRINLFVRPIAWIVSPCLANIDEYEDTVIGEGMRGFVWDSVKRCRPDCRGSCRGKDTGGKTVMMLGREIHDICGEVFYVNNKKIDYSNPDKDAIERIKKLLELEKIARNNSK